MVCPPSKAVLPTVLDKWRIMESAEGTVATEE
jgi:hypothetical protein